MPTGNPSASVVMPVYNERPDRLAKAVDSILRQTFPDFELVIVDDGSTNIETLRYLRDLEGTDYRIRLFFLENNLGVSGALNFGLRVARAPIVFRHDQDDWSDPQRFAIQYAYMQEHPEVALLGTSSQTYQESGRPLSRSVFPSDPDEILRAFKYQNVFSHGSVCFRRERVLELGGYREDVPGVEDYDLFWRMSERWPSSNLPDVLYHRMLHATSATPKSFRTRHLYREITRLRAESRKVGPEMSFEEAKAIAETSRRPSMSDIKAALGDDLMRAGNYGSALRAYLEAIFHWPPRMKPLAKLVRLGMFIAMPRWRYKFFVHKGRKSAAPVRQMPSDRVLT